MMIAKIDQCMRVEGIKDRNCAEMTDAYGGTVRNDSEGKKAGVHQNNESGFMAESEGLRNKTAAKIAKDRREKRGAVPKKGKDSDLRGVVDVAGNGDDIGPESDELLSR